MKKIVLTYSTLFYCFIVLSQSTPSLIIDGKQVKFKSNISLPYWLEEGRTLTLGANAISVSILEFTIDSNTLLFNKTIHLTSMSVVPAGKTWKIEAIGIGLNPSYPTSRDFSNDSIPSIFTSPIVYSEPGEFIWTVPPGVSSICIEIWGPGGRGGYKNSSNPIVGGGGGGSYGYQCLNVNSGDVFNLKVGSGSSNNQDTSFFDTIIFAAGGEKGGVNLALGGSSNADFNISGGNGDVPRNPSCSQYYAGYGANGGKGGISSFYCNYGGSSDGSSGSSPGGGGGRGNGITTYGGSGRIKIFF